MSIDFYNFSDDALKTYYEFIDHVLEYPKDIPTIEILIWTAVAKELDYRKLITLIRGSYDDILNAKIKRNW